MSKKPPKKVIISTKKPIYSTITEGRYTRYFDSDGREISAEEYKRKVKQNPMSKKKKARKKRNRRPRKGVMPAALKAYWAKKRAAKNRKKKNSRRRPAKRKANRRRTRSRSRRNARPRKAASVLLSELRQAGYAIAPKANRRRRRRKANRRKKANPRSIRIPGTVTPKQRRAIGRFLARATGKRIVYKKAGRR